jgi:hypothetical protein
MGSDHAKLLKSRIFSTKSTHYQALKAVFYQQKGAFKQFPSLPVVWFFQARRFTA